MLVSTRQTLRQKKQKGDFSLSLVWLLELQVDKDVYTVMSCKLGRFPADHTE